MSRTYHHGDKAKERLFGNNHWPGTRKPAPPKRRRTHAGWHWMSTPSSWIKMMMTRPQRALVRDLITKTKRLADLEEAPLFPVAKKPHIYYW